LLPCLLAGCGGGKKETVTVFAAISTKEALEQIASDFEHETGTHVETSFAASSTLAKQIEQGAAADLFLSADEDWADYLGGRDRVERRRDLLANRLVVIVPAKSPRRVRNLRDLADVEKLAVADEAVPAGRYARAALKKEGVWERVQGRIPGAGSVRAALNQVIKDEADAGLVYATDAAAAGDKVRVAFEVPEALHPPIRYPLVVVRPSGIRPAVDRFYKYLGEEGAAAVFRRAGFQILPP
jgi:molybdate transport system substrate-binding protein